MSVSYVIIVTTMFILFYAASGVRNIVEVERMQIVIEAEESNDGAYDYDLDLLQYLGIGADLETAPMVTDLKVSSFSWKNCGSSSDLLVINDLSVTPDPVRIPGAISLTFNISIKEIFDSPLKLALEVEKYEAFFWLHIPCIDGKGSCTFDDICPQLASSTCPKPFVDNNIPCKCPFSQGNYSLPTSIFTVKVTVPNGKYNVQSKLSYGSKAVSCTKIYFSIS
uniref:MD-2-related lipid-recognition domain-containing protein n=1 Tax=Arion vulgaris TaxID=1028688 RepID=A0A0B6YZD6_9EUPU